MHLGPDALVGPAGWYLSRPGFWWGAAGLVKRLLGGWRDDPISLSHLGAAHASVEAARAMVAAAAAAIDAEPAMPSDAAARLAYVTRHMADLTAGSVIEHTTRALGPGPMTQDEPVSQLLSDLALYVRQSHAERDLATLGRLVVRHANASG